MGPTTPDKPAGSPSIVAGEIIPGLERLIALAKADGEPFLAHLMDMALIEARHIRKK